MAPSMPIHRWTVSSLIGAFLDLTLAYLLLCIASLAFAASTILSFLRLSLPSPINGLFGHPQTILVDLPAHNIAAAHSDLTSRFPFDSFFPPNDTPSYTRTHSLGTHGRDAMMLAHLERVIEDEQAARAALALDLEKERSAAASAADEAMAMILRLQEEKAAVQMEASQFRRMVEEKSVYDEEEMEILKEIVFRREMEKLFLEKEVEGYRQKMVMFPGGKEEKTLEDDMELVRSDDSLDDPVLMLHRISESLGQQQAKGVEDAVGDGDIKQGHSFDKHHLDVSDSECEINLEFQEKGVVKENDSPPSEQSQKSSYEENTMLYEKSQATSVLFSEVNGAADQKARDQAQLEAELGVLDVYVVDDKLNLGDGGNDKEIDPAVESSGTSMIGLTYSNPVSGWGSMERKVNRSCSDMASDPRLMDSLCHESSPFGLRSSMSNVDNERSKLEIEVELLRRRLKAIQQGREKLSLNVENKEKESSQIELLDEIACQLHEMKKTTGAEKNVRQASKPPPSSKLISKKKALH